MVKQIRLQGAGLKSILEALELQTDDAFDPILGLSWSSPTNMSFYELIFIVLDEMEIWITICFLV